MCNQTGFVDPSFNKQQILAQRLLAYLIIFHFLFNIQEQIKLLTLAYCKIGASLVARLKFISVITSL